MIVVVAKVKKQGFLVGYRFLNMQNKKSMFCKIVDLEPQVRSIPMSMRDFDYINGELVCLNGDIDRLPVMTYHGNEFECSENDFVIVLEEIHSFEPGQVGVIGYCVTDFQAQIMDLTVEEFLAYENVGYWNAKVERNLGEVRIKPLKGKLRVGVRPSNFTATPEMMSEVHSTLNKHFPGVL